MGISPGIQYRYRAARFARPRRIPVALVVGLVLAVAGTCAAGQAAAEVHRETATAAVAALNAQRTANGIPAGLKDISALSRGCWQYTNLYVQKPGQYPHEEVEGQPGYTALGDRAASLSDLYPEEGSESLGTANANTNPWASAPLHLISLFNPIDEYAWFGAGSYGLCMGTDFYNPLSPGNAGERQFRAPTSFSLPGNGRANVLPAEHAYEIPWTPQQAVHLSAGRTTGPYIILFPELPSPDRIAEISLVRGNGAVTPVRVVTPETPAPPSPPGWPKVTTVGGYSEGAYFVIPPRPLWGNARYQLTVHWADRSGHYVQVVAFKTTCDLSNWAAYTARPTIMGCPRGS